MGFAGEERIDRQWRMLGLSSPRLGLAGSDKLKDNARRPGPPSSSSEVLNLTLTLYR